MIGIPDDVVIFSRFHDEHFSRVHRLAATVDLDLSSSLHNDKDFVVRMYVLPFRVRPPTNRMETESAMDDIPSRNHGGCNVLRSLRP